MQHWKDVGSRRCQSLLRTPSLCRSSTCQTTACCRRPASATRRARRCMLARQLLSNAARVSTAWPASCKSQPYSWICPFGKHARINVALAGLGHAPSCTQVAKYQHVVVANDTCSHTLRAQPTNTHSAVTSTGSTSSACRIAISHIHLGELFATNRRREFRDPGQLPQVPDDALKLRMPQRGEALRVRGRKTPTHTSQFRGFVFRETVNIAQA